jgi:two-component system LytT family response regulator
MIRTLIIDDEQHNRQLIADLLRDHFPNISLIGEADGVKSGLKSIRELTPDLVLLDIRMEDGDAFDLLNQVGYIHFKIIFITAYEEYALKAIKFSALDYLLKPVSLDELKLAINKAEKQISKDLNLQLAELSNNLQQNHQNKRIVLRTAEKLQLIPAREIVRCEAERNYCMFFLENGKKIIASCPMKDYEDMLSEQGFFRIHKSHLVNLSYVDSYIKAEGGSVVMTDGTILPVSMRKKNQLMELFEKL